MKTKIVALVVLSGLGLAALATSRNSTESSAVASSDLSLTPAVVLELFTSQGCSSCPPADALLAKFLHESDANLFALSYHVDYWNYIGWKDPFSKPEYTARQSKYNQKFGSRSNYTPQIVVNGQEHFVGSNLSELKRNIAIFSKKPTQNGVEITEVNREGKIIKLSYSVYGPMDDKYLRAALVINRRTTAVERGENRNRQLTNSNIVVAALETSLNKTSGIIQMRIPPIVEEQDKLKMILLLENSNMDIAAATQTGTFLYN